MMPKAKISAQGGGLTASAAFTSAVPCKGWQNPIVACMTQRVIEREFGVPIPGEILEPSQWTKTALKKLPAAGPIDWETIFGRRAPLIVDIGCGNGRYLL